MEMKENKPGITFCNKAESRLCCDTEEMVSD